MKKKKTKFNINFKIILYKSLWMSIWACGIQTWGAAEISNIPTFQSITLRIITRAPSRRVQPRTHHSDLSINSISGYALLMVYERLQKKCLVSRRNPPIEYLSSTPAPEILLSFWTLSSVHRPRFPPRARYEKRSERENCPINNT